MKQKKLSVIIPVKNGADTLGRCLSSVRNQTVEDIEIIILDSMSSDSSAAIAAEYGAVIIPVPDGTFNHGLTRNLGVANANGELVYLTVQDAWIADAGMFEKMIAHFEQEEIMGVSGHQAVPHEMDKNPIQWYRPYSKPTITEKRVENEATFNKLSVDEQKSLIAWDNVVAMYRKSALTAQPFVETAFAEDLIWSYQALLKSWKLIYDPSLVVYHYHHRTFTYTFMVAYSLNYHLYKYFRFLPALPPLLEPTIKSVYHLFKNRDLSFKKKIYWIFHDFASRTGNFISVFNFLTRLKTGGVGRLEQGYQKYCKLVPQGKQKNNIEKSIKNKF